MATNILDEGDTIPFTCTGTVATGALVLAGNMFGIALSAGVSGGLIALRIGCRCSLAKHTTDTFAVGDYVYWDNTNHYVTSTSSGNTKIGVATKAGLSADTTQHVHLNESF